MKKKSLIIVFVLVTLLSVFAMPAFAQSEGTISGSIYEDLNGNGVRDANEPGLKDVEVQFVSGGWNTTISSIDDGTFSIRVNPATWTVTVLPSAGWRVTTSNSVDAFIGAPGDAVDNLEFGVVRVVTDADGNEILPASGGFVSDRIIIGGLFGILAVGVGLVVAGQRKKKTI